MSLYSHLIQMVLLTTNVNELLTLSAPKNLNFILVYRQNKLSYLRKIDYVENINKPFKKNY